MANQFKLPELGENVSSGTVSKVFISVGDSIEPDQPVIELESDKAVLEVPSSIGGTVSEIHVKEGQKVNVGDAVFSVKDGAKAKDEPKKAEAPAEEKPEPKPEADAEPDAPAKKPAAEDAESDGKEAEAPATRRAPKERPAARQAESRPAPAPPVPARRRTPGAPVAASPSVRRLAREIGVDIYEVATSDPSGRVTEEDVKAYARGLNTDVEGMAPRPAVPEIELPDFTRWGEVEYEELSAVRRRTAENMAAAWASIPHVTQFDKADITDIEAFRKKYGKLVEQAGGKLTVTAILVRVIAAALKKFPQFNATIDTASGEIIYKRYYHVGVAVDTERGLIVPVIRNADQKSLTEIAVELSEIAEKARARKTSLEDMQGGTFTISNLGGIGGTAFTPIVYAPQVAILGVSRAQIEPVYIDGTFVPRTMAPLALSYDHRAIDGADGARFLRWVAAALEQPLLQLLDA